MIKTRKQRLFRALLFLLLFFVLPIIIFSRSAFGYFRPAAVFYFTLIFSACLLSRKYSQAKNAFSLSHATFDEKCNSLLDEINRLEVMRPALKRKISRYLSLENIVEELNKDVRLEYAGNKLLDISFDTVTQNQGTALLYLVDQEAHKLYLFAARKEDKSLVVKAKEGDIFDQWVLRHAAPLLVEDIRKDFRFDLERLKDDHQRPLSSLISVALINKDKFFGILRLDSPKANYFTQDDLRLLNTVSDLGAIALGNAQLFEKTLELAIKDGLTSLYTRRFFIQRLEEELKRANLENREFSLFMIDIDHFKDYNDKFGHIAGDIVLKRISELMSGFFEKHAATLSRFGGEEFAVILPNRDKKSALSLAQDLCALIRASAINLRRKDVFVTVSAGVSCFPQDTRQIDELIRTADSALYKAKGAGRDQACCL